MRRHDAGMTPSGRWQRCRALLLLCYSLLPASAMARFFSNPPAAIGAKWALRQLRQDDDKHVRHRLDQASTCDGDRVSSDVGECILLFGALYKANMGDAAQPLAVEHLLASAAPPDQCFWYAHPWGEQDDEQEKHTAELSNGPTSCSIPLTADYAKEVNRFKALVIGGGKLVRRKLKHAPYEIDSFFEDLTLPVVILGVGASYKGKQYSKLLRKAAFLSGRDIGSTKVFSTVLLSDDGSSTRPDNVALVRDPVLSDKTLTDTGGACWKQSEGEHKQQLCFVLPVSSKQRAEMHRHLVDRVVGPGDVFVNVSPPHQKELEGLHYPGEVLQIFDPTTFAERLCSCRAIVSTELHGAILGLHMGVPTLGAFRKSKRSDVRDLMVDTMRLPDQFFEVDEHVTRQAVDVQVAAVRESYAHQGLRASVHARLAGFFEDFQHHAHHVLFDVIGVSQQQEQQQQQKQKQQEEQKKQRQQEEEKKQQEGQKKQQQQEEQQKQQEEQKKQQAEQQKQQQQQQQQQQQHQQQQGDVTQAKPEVVEEKATKDAGKGSVEEKDPSVSAVPPSAAEDEGKTTKNISKTGESATADAVVKHESPSLAAVLFANRSAFKRPWDTVADQVKGVPSGERKSGDSPRPKVVSTAHHHAEPKTSSVPPAGDEASAETHDTVVQKSEEPAEATAAHHPASEPDVAGWTSKASPGSADANANGGLPTPVRGSASDVVLPTEGVSWVKLVSNDYLTAVLLIAAIAGLAVFPSGGTSKKAPYVKVVDVEDAHRSRRHVTHYPKSDDLEPSACSKQVTAHTPRSAAASPRTSGTPCRIIFMLNFTMWVFLSMGFVGYGNAYLSDTQDPVGLLVLQGAAGMVVLCSLERLGVLDPHSLKDLVPAVIRRAGPAALLYTCQALATNSTVCVGGAAMTNALKATEPFAAAVVSYFLLGEVIPPGRMAALPVIVAGTVLVMLEGNKDAGLSGGGDGGGYFHTSVVLPMAAVCFNALRNVVIKKGKTISAHQTLLACSVAATVVGIGLMLLTLMWRGVHDLFEEEGTGNVTERGGGGGSEVGTGHNIWPRIDGVNAALCFVGYNLASLNLLLRLSPVSHAVGNACKRMLVFAIGLLFVGEVMTIGQLGGTAVALLGVLTYNFGGTGETRLLR